MGVVIGETSEIGNNVTLYHGVTLGGISPAEDSSKQINQIQNIYRIIYLEGRNNSQAVKKIKSGIKDSNEKSIVLNFLENSDRGIIKGIID